MARFRSGLTDAADRRRSSPIAASIVPPVPPLPPPPRKRDFFVRWQKEEPRAQEPSSPALGGGFAPRVRNVVARTSGGSSRSHSTRRAVYCPRRELSPSDAILCGTYRTRGRMGVAAMLAAINPLERGRFARERRARRRCPDGG